MILLSKIDVPGRVRDFGGRVSGAGTRATDPVAELS